MKMVHFGVSVNGMTVVSHPDMCTAMNRVYGVSHVPSSSGSHWYL
jgi:hypothetical protein